MTQIEHSQEHSQISVMLLDTVDVLNENSLSQSQNPLKADDLKQDDKNIVFEESKVSAVKSSGRKKKSRLIHDEKLDQDISHLFQSSEINVFKPDQTCESQQKLYKDTVLIDDQKAEEPNATQTSSKLDRLIKDVSSFLGSGLGNNKIMKEPSSGVDLLA